MQGVWQSRAAAPALAGAPKARVFDLVESSGTATERRAFGKLARGYRLLLIEVYASAAHDATPTNRVAADLRRELIGRIADGFSHWT